MVHEHARDRVAQRQEQRAIHRRQHRLELLALSSVAGVHRRHGRDHELDLHLAQHLGLGPVEAGHGA